VSGSLYGEAVRLLRKLASPLPSVATAIGFVLTGAPPELIDTTAASAGQFMQNMLSPERKRTEEPSTADLLTQRAQALDDFGRSTTLAWHAAGILMSTRPKPLGFVHTLTLLIRSQRQFEDSMAKAAASLSAVLLYTTPDTQDAALDLFSELGSQLTLLAKSGKPGSRKAVLRLENSSVALGHKVVAWRTSARQELAIGS